MNRRKIKYSRIIIACCIWAISGMFFTSCFSSYHLVLDVREPAAVTLPKKIENVLFVNNSVPQPEEVGIIRIINGNENTDLAYPENHEFAENVIKSAVNSTRNSDFFNKMAYYVHPVRTDNQWITVTPLDKYFKNELFQQNEYDAIISIDRILHASRMKGDSKNIGASLIEASVDIVSTTQIIGSIYIPEKEEAAATFSVGDTLTRKYTIDVEAEAAVFFEQLSQNILNEASRQAGRRLGRSFIPHWKSQDRLIYAGFDSRMREAYSFSLADNWEAAEAIWLAKYNKESNPKKKVKLAANIALVYEIQDDFETAIEWLEKAKQHIEEAKMSGESSEAIYVRDYTNALKQRQLSTNLLDIQMQDN